MSKIPVSVCIIAKNEEKYIGECLKRLEPYGFEIVVTDTGSTDQTVEIAKQYTDKVFEFEWVSDFSAARNFCVSHASNNWILALDCDEYVHSIDVSSLRRIMQQYPRALGEIQMKSLVQSRGVTSYAVDVVRRFYNKNYYFFEGAIHEQIQAKDEKQRGKAFEEITLPMEVIHHGYNLTPEEMKKKSERNLTMLYQALETDPNNTYMLYQAAHAESMRGNYFEAILLYERALGMIETVTCEFERLMIMALGVDYVRTGQFQKAVALMERYADQCKTAKYMFTHANVLLDSGDHLRALLLYIKTIMMPDADTLGVNKLHCFENIIRIYTEIGNTEMAALFQQRYEECRQENDKIVTGTPSGE